MMEMLKIYFEFITNTIRELLAHDKIVGVSHLFFFYIYIFCGPFTIIATIINCVDKYLSVSKMIRAYRKLGRMTSDPKILQSALDNLTDCALKICEQDTL